MPRKPLYPYETIAVGEAFDVTHTTNVAAIRSLASYYARKLGRRFEVRWIDAEKVIEVSRLPDGGVPVEVKVPRSVLGVLGDDRDWNAEIDEARRRIDAS